MEEAACKAAYVDASSAYSSLDGSTQWWVSGLESRASRRAEGSIPLLSAMEDTRPVRSHAANVVGRQPTGFDSQVFR